jgi:hypothetical protein
LAKNSTVPFPLLAYSQLWSGNVSFFTLDSSRRQIKDYGGSLLSDLGKKDLSDIAKSKSQSIEKFKEKFRKVKLIAIYQQLRTGKIPKALG